MYFQVRTDQTARGSYEQLTDSSGNKLWSIAISNSPLEVRIVNDKDLEGEYKQYAADAKPKLGWTGAYMEGIFQSYIHLFKDLGIGTYEALRNGDTSVYKNYGRSMVRREILDIQMYFKVYMIFYYQHYLLH